MNESLYGTPVTTDAILIRHAPATPLLVSPLDQHPTQAYMMVAQPKSWPAMSPAERAALTPYFEFDQDDSYWWQTLRPARIEVRHVTASIRVGRLIEPGLVIRAGDDPDRPPDAEYVFRSVAVSTAITVRDPAGPRLKPDAFGNTEVLRTPAGLLTRATMATLGADTLWLRVFSRGFERDAHLRALDSELRVLRHLHESAPGGAAEVLWAGRLDTSFHCGRCVATRAIVGLSTAESFASAGTPPFGSMRSVVRGIAADVALLFARAHAEGLCLGPLSPGLVRVRPDCTGLELPARAQLAMLPGAGPEGGGLPPSAMELFPEGTADPLASQFAKRYRRNEATDLAAFSCFVDWIVSSAAYRDPELSRIVAEYTRAKTGRAQALHAELASLATSTGEPGAVG